MTPIVAKTMAPAPFGHAVTTQKSSTAPTARKARPALTRGGSQSGTEGKTLRRRGTGRAESTTSSASPLSAWETPANTLAVTSAIQTDGVGYPPRRLLSLGL